MEGWLQAGGHRQAERGLGLRGHRGQRDVRPRPHPLRRVGDGLRLLGGAAHLALRPPHRMVQAERTRAKPAERQVLRQLLARSPLQYCFPSFFSNTPPRTYYNEES